MPHPFENSAQLSHGQLAIPLLRAEISKLGVIRRKYRVEWRGQKEVLLEEGEAWPLCLFRTIFMVVGLLFLAVLTASTVLSATTNTTNTAIDPCFLVGHGKATTDMRCCYRSGPLSAGTNDSPLDLRCWHRAQHTQSLHKNEETPWRRINETKKT